MTKPTATENEWLGIEEVSELFGLSRNTARQLLRDHNVEALRLRSRLRFNAEEVHRLYNQSRTRDW